MIALLILSTLLGVILAQYAPAVDINQQGTASNFQCLYQNKYAATVFIRAYKSDGTGTVDNNAVPNINLAFKSFLGIEVYMTPNPTSGKDAYMQVDEVVTALQNGGVRIKSLWIQVTSPVHWNNNQAANLNFITSAIQRLRARGIRPGIYTSNYDWQQITNGAGNLGNDVMLWYWSVYSTGSNGETVPNFNDFRPFGNWLAPTVKQYGQAEGICGFTLNKDVYSTTASVKANQKVNVTVEDKEKQIIVGTIGL